MPRQLPWANKGGGSRTQVKRPIRLAKGPRITTDIDDDVFDGTILARTRKGKGRADDGSDDDFPDLPAEPSTPRTKRKIKDTLRTERVQSSSPPPVQDLEELPVETMRKGVSKFDLRDDEWMMVEDEFLETAKLFTQHLHIAEYERLKEVIEEKKKEAEVARPVVADVKMSFEGMMKEKAKVQEIRQRKAFRDVFAYQAHEDEDLVFTGIRVNNTAKLNRSPNKPAARDIDSDDLDASGPPTRHLLPRTAPVTTTLVPPRRIAAGTKPALATRTDHTALSSIKGPAPPPTTAIARVRPSRATPFDMLDDYTPKRTATTHKPGTAQHPTQASSAMPRQILPAKSLDPTPFSGRRSSDAIAGQGSGKAQGTTGVSKDTAERLAKRKAEREKDEEKQNRRAVKLDDIPTFLF